MSVFAIRVCRHCRAAAGLDDTKCKKCKKPLMNPDGFKALLFSMIAMIIIVYAALFYAYVSVQNAYASVCPKSFYERQSVPEDTTCAQVCGASCNQKDAGEGTGVLITTGYNANAVEKTISCHCTCSACLEN